MEGKNLFGGLLAWILDKEYRPEIAVFYSWFQAQNEALKLWALLQENLLDKKTCNLTQFMWINGYSSHTHWISFSVINKQITEGLQTACLKYV